MMMRHIFLSSALAIGWGVCGSAQTAEFQSPLLGFYEAGVLCAQEGGEERTAPGTVAGTTHVIADAPPFVSNGRMVPAVIGIGFGVRAGLAGGFDQDGVVMTVTHPPFEGSGATTQSFTTHLRSDAAPGVTFYQFDYRYELALGDWTMKASYGGVTFYETTFTVVPPSALPELADACNYLDLIG